MKNLKKPKLYLQVYNELREYIRKNELKPGDKLPTEMEMCDLLGVSRNVLREAIKSLEITGLVRSTPGIGCVIQEFNADYLYNTLIYNLGTEQSDLADQFRRIRRVLELGFAREAFEQISQEQLDILAGHVETMRSIAKRQAVAGTSTTTFGSKFAEADAAFHRVLYSSLDLPLLVAIVDSFWAYDKNYAKPVSPEYLMFTVKKHEKIWEALNDRDFEAYCAAIDIHYRVVFHPGESGAPNEELYTEAYEKYKNF